MVESLQILLGGVIDYAGMYPPAELPLNEALRSYVRYKQGKEAWIVDRFICPASKVSELEAALKWQNYDARFGLCATGRKSEDNAEFLSNALIDIKAARRAVNVFFDAFETRLPVSALDSADLSFLILRIVRALEDETELYLEIPMTENWESEIPRAIEAIAKSRRCRAKIRCGGPSKEAVPTVDQLALFISACASAKVPFKATAGLHHPIRTVDERAGTQVHGFMNVLVAAAVARTFDASRADLISILSATDTSCFRCLESRISVGNWHLSLKQLRAARDFVIGYGSCSVNEPLADLAQMGHAMRVSVS